jgi:secreted PhoX family phosphatase
MCRVRSRSSAALGRFGHEAATTVINKDGRAVSMGDDDYFEYAYRFVSNGTSRSQRPQQERRPAG